MIYEDDPELDRYVSDIECTRDQIREGLLNGRWTVHHVDPVTGVTWFDPIGQPPRPEPDDFADDLIAGAMIADRPAAEPETTEVPFDITAASWYPELQANGTADIPGNVVLRFVDRRTDGVQITPGGVASND